VEGTYLNNQPQAQKADEVCNHTHTHTHTHTTPKATHQVMSHLYMVLI